MNFRISFSLLFLNSLQIFLHTEFVSSDEGSCVNSEEFLLPDTEDSLLTLMSQMNIQTGRNGEYQLESTLNVSRNSMMDCGSLQYANMLSSLELIGRLTAPCRYDRLAKPPTADSKPLNVTTRAYVSGIQTVASSGSQFTMQVMLKLIYQDTRLAFGQYATQRLDPIKGDSELSNMIWLPHVLITNPQSDDFVKNILISISPVGEVILVFRLDTILYCSLQSSSFPFDEQYCASSLESWLYNSSELMLYWTYDAPLTFNAEIDLQQYELKDSWYTESIVDAAANGLWQSPGVGNYSALSFTLHFLHDSSYYVMDFFIPSIIIVASSWVSFWIRADQTATRTILGCHTMLSLITLSAGQMKDTSEFNAIFEVWFLGCVLFIFASLVEFAFSNTVQRRKRDVRLKKCDSRNILKSTMMPRSMRRRLTIFEGSPKIESIKPLIESPILMTSCSTISEEFCNATTNSRPFAKFFQGDFPSSPPPLPSPLKKQINLISRPFATMTPQEVSDWLDRKARLVFPIAFLVFNALFWTFVLVL